MLIPCFVRKLEKKCETVCSFSIFETKNPGLFPGPGFESLVNDKCFPVFEFFFFAFVPVGNRAEVTADATVDLRFGCAFTHFLTSFESPSWKH